MNSIDKRLKETSAGGEEKDGTEECHNGDGRITKQSMDTVRMSFAISKMASRGPQDALSTNCPVFGDQLNGRTCHVRCDSWSEI